MSSPFFSSLHEPPSLVSRFNLSFLSLSLSFTLPSLPFLALQKKKDPFGWKSDTRMTGAGVVRDTIRTKKSRVAPGRLRVRKSRRIALSRWLPPRRRNDTPRDRRRMRRKGRESAMPVLCRVLRGWRVSERGCFSTTSCSRHPQTPLDPDATPKEKEGERKGGGGEGREGWQTIKVPNSFPTVHFALSSLRRFGLFDLNTRTHIHTHTDTRFTDVGYTRCIHVGAWVSRA